MLRFSLGSWSSCLRMYSQSFLVSSVRGSGSLPTTAASAASGCTGLLREFLGEAAFFGVGIRQLERAGPGSQAKKQPCFQRFAGAPRRIWLNSNKGTKRDRPFRLSALMDWIFGLWATPKMAPHLVHQFWGLNSDSVSQALAASRKPHVLSDGPIRMIQSDLPAGKRMRRRR